MRLTVSRQIPSAAVSKVHSQRTVFLCYQRPVHGVFVGQTSGQGQRQAHGLQSRLYASEEQAATTLTQEDEQYAVLIECDGILTDLHVDGHMAAFNRAFSELGYDCVNWNVVIYHDLLRTGDGTGLGMISTYFGRVGWPVMLASSDRKQFAQQVYDKKRKHLKELLSQGVVPLRPGAANFMEAVKGAGVKVGLITETNSTPEDHAVDAVLEALGPLAEGIRVFPTTTDHEECEEEEDGPRLSFDQQVQAMQARMKAANATTFATATLSSSNTLHIGVNPHLLTAHRSGSLLSPSFISVASATLSVPLSNVAVLAATNLVMQAAKGAGALSIAAPPSLSARGGFPAADVTFDGFGPGGGATWPRMKGLLTKKNTTATTKVSTAN